MPILEIALVGSLLYSGKRALQKRTREKKRAMQRVLNNGSVVEHPDNENALTQIGWKLQNLTSSAVDKVWGVERNRQLAEMDVQTAPEDTLRQDDVSFAISVGSLGLTVLGRLLFPPLALIGIPGLVYVIIPYVKDGVRNLFEERKIKSYLVDVIVLPGALLAGYFTASALGSVFFFASRVLLGRSENRARRSVTNIFGKHDDTVWVLVDGEEVEIPFEQLVGGQIVVVHAGQMIPADGIVQEGMGTVDQRMLTGESQPSEKSPGDEVLAATILLSGRICVQAEKTGDETVAAKIGEILSQTADYQLTIVSRGEAVADRAALPMLALSAVAWPLLGVQSALAVLMSYVGYNMRIVAPISMLNFLDVTSHNGILIKDARSLEILNKIDTVVFDKTGTLTLDQPRLGQIYAYSEFSEDEVLTYAAAAEAKQTHPIARAIVQEARARNLPPVPIEDARYDIGFGIRVQLNGRTVRVGSRRFIVQESIPLPADIDQIQATAQAQGHSVVLVAFDDQVAGTLVLEPMPRPEAQEVVDALRARNLELYIISGDQEEPTRSLAQSLGISNYFADTLPENKAQLIEQLQAEGRTVCFVGDGINDAIALQQADVSISLRGASTIATDTAQIILMDGDFRQFVFLLKTVSSFETNMQGNLITSLVPGIICIGGVFFLHWGLVTAIAIYNVGLAAGVANAMLPLRLKKPRANSEITEV